MRVHKFSAAGILVGALLLICNSAVAATWNLVQTPSKQKIVGIAYTDNIHAFAIADKGDVLTTANAGGSWHLLTNLPAGPSFLNGIAYDQFTAHLYIVGSSGLIWMSPDQGATWYVQSSPLPINLRAVAVGTNHNATAVGAGGEIIGTVDDGQHWFVRYSDAQNDLYAVRYGAPGEVWAAGAGGTIVKSTDNGMTWAQKNSSTTVDLHDIYFDGTTGYAVGDSGTLMKTTNDGDLWTKVILPNDPTGYNAYLSRISGFSGGALSAMSTIGTVLTTYDGGVTWSQTLTPNKAALLRSVASYYSLSHLLIGTEGGYVAQVTIPVQPTAPSLIVGPVANGGTTTNAQPTISWNASSVVEAAIAGYEVKTNGGSFVSVGNVLSYTPNAALANGTYTFSVRAVSDAGAYSAAANYVVTIAVPAAAPAPAPAPAVPAPAPVQPPAQQPAQPVIETPNGNNVPTVFFGAISAGSLIKLECPDGASVSHPCRAVYFVDGAGKRHAFPNAKVYATWYSNFDSVQSVDGATLASFPLGKNVTYRPGVRMVKFTTNNVVYAVSKFGALRPIASADVAAALYGPTWNKQIDDISDAFAGDFSIGVAVNAAADFSPVAEQAAASVLLGNF